MAELRLDLVSLPPSLLFADLSRNGELEPVGVVAGVSGLRVLEAAFTDAGPALDKRVGWLCV